MTTVNAPMCCYCTHLHPMERGKVKETCNAFPEGIPDDIYLRHGDHTVPREGDHGIQYTPRSEGAKAWFLRLYPDAANPPT